MNCYQILGLTPHVSMDEIKAAYRAAAAKNHPDLGGSHQAMVEINSAFEQAKWELEHFRVRNNPQYSPPQPTPKPQPQPQPQPKSKPETPRAQKHQPIADEDLMWWRQYIDRLLDVAELNGYKPTTVAFWLLECRSMPPMTAWEYLCEQLGNKKGWAWHQFRKWRFERDKNYPN